MTIIKSSSEISNIFAQGKRFDTPFIAILVMQSTQHGSQGRVAFVAGKKNGNAVWRNAAKRRLREVCRAAGGPWSGFDVVFIAKRKTNVVSYSKVLEACKRLVDEAKLDHAGNR